MYKLIALDMDGTLLNNAKQITPRTFDAIQAAKQAGITVVLASGRPLEGLTPHLEHLGLTTDDDFVVCYNGSLVQRVGNGEVLHQTALQGKDAKLLHQYAEQMGVFIHAFCPQKGLITHKENPWTSHEARINAIPVSETDFSQLTNDNELIKIMLVADESQLDLAIDNLPEQIKQRYTVVRSAPFFLEFLHLDSNKGVAIASLAETLGFEASEVICAGDADNDRHMLEYAGLAVAMENADPAIKAIAHYIAPSNEEDGVAVAIEEHALKPATNRIIRVLSNVT